MNKLKISNDELATEWHTLHFLSTQSVMNNNTRSRRVSLLSDRDERMLGLR
jgi:hypothetical protein